ncbi:methyltransferase-like protein 25 isoform X2 [Hypomesus transpacificus]|uniref:methyltransferase-like protein 25 isoform X2 n=1 Tax=Hypomesus transpacificus TaxID=137520 RepID=UPI001F07D334|nr:methyltransferase-like protein 25 isoform X2 [Hypomesus transpacificus]
MASHFNSLEAIRNKIDEVKQFLSVTLSIANAHTVDFYTRDVWDQFMSVPPAELLAAISGAAHKRPLVDCEIKVELADKTKTKTTFGFCTETKRLVNVDELLKAAKAHSLSGLGVCMSRNDLLESLKVADPSPPEEGPVIEPGEFMNSKKSHEVRAMSEVVSSLARHCRVKQVIDVGSGKGYLCSFLSLQYGLRVYGIDSSSTNTHGAQELNRKLKKYSRAYQKHSQVGRKERGGACAGEKKPVDDNPEKVDTSKPSWVEKADWRREAVSQPSSAESRPTERRVTSQNNQDKIPSPSLPSVPNWPEVNSVADGTTDPETPELEAGDLFLSTLSVDAIDPVPPRTPSSELSVEERERRKMENLQRKAQNRANGDSGLYSPLTSYVTAETELREIISELEDAVMVGLHTCGDLAPSTLRMFAAKQELLSVCSVGCCYHFLSEEYDPNTQDCPVRGVCGFPMSRYLRDQSWFCGRNARMSACLALERVAVGQGIQMESLFYRAVLHVILRDHYSSFKSESRVGDVYSKASSFVDYVRKAVTKLGLDETKLSDSAIQDYQDTFIPRMCEMQAFNMLKVMLAPCIEGLILLDRLCYLKEQEDVSFSTLVQLFDPVLSPRCYGVVGVKTPGTA